MGNCTGHACILLRHCQCFGFVFVEYDLNQTLLCLRCDYLGDWYNKTTGETQLNR